MIGGSGRMFLGLQRNEWLDLHAWIAVTIAAVVIIHLVIRWRWIINMTLGKSQVNAKRPGLKTVYDLGEPKAML